MQTRQTLTDNQLRPLSFSMFLPTFFHATKLDRIVVDAYSSANAKQRAVFLHFFTLTNKKYNKSPVP